MASGEGSREMTRGSIDDCYVMISPETNEHFYLTMAINFSKFVEMFSVTANATGNLLFRTDIH